MITAAAKVKTAAKVKSPNTAVAVGSLHVVNAVILSPQDATSPMTISILPAMDLSLSYLILVKLELREVGKVSNSSSSSSGCTLSVKDILMSTWELGRMSRAMPVVPYCTEEGI